MQVMGFSGITRRVPRLEDRFDLQRQIVGSLPSAIPVFDLETLVLADHNAAARELLDRAFADRRFGELIGRAAAEVFPRFEEVVAPLIRRAIETGSSCTIDRVALGSDGAREVSAAATFKPIGAGTETRHLMVSMIEVAEKTAVLERQQYLQRMESVGTLAGGLAHDVNNVLTVIVGNAHLLRETVPASPNVDESLAAIEEAAQRAQKLTSKLMTFAKGGSSSRGPVSLNGAIRDTLRLLATSMRSGVIFDLDLEPELAPVSAESDGIHQILLNLFVNARDAMDGRGRLSVRTRREEGWVILEVEDSGPGIPDSILPYIFDPFFTTKNQSGTGLGLSVLYGLVQSYGGSVSAATSPNGGGALFRVLLPAC